MQRQKNYYQNHQIGIHLHNAKKGFTLIEVLLVLALLSMLLVLAMPNYQQIMANLHLQSTAYEIAAQIRQTRVIAIKENRSIRILCSTGPTGTQQIAKYRGVSVIRPAYRVFSDITVSGLDFTFHANGNINLGGSVTIRSRLGNTLQIVMQPVTGRVVIREV